MLAVIFEVEPNAEDKEEYLAIAGQLRELLQEIDGFISIERFQSLVDEKRILSLSFWRDEKSVMQWRSLMEHRSAQARGRKGLFDNYRIRVAEVLRDYSMTERDQAPTDSRQVLENDLPAGL